MSSDTPQTNQAEMEARQFFVQPTIGNSYFMFGAVEILLRTARTLERALQAERQAHAHRAVEDEDHSAGRRLGGTIGIGRCRGLIVRLLRLLLGQLAPKSGVVDHGTRLEVVYFDQLRAQLDETMRVQDAVADGNATVTINGRTRHVISYLEDFLFEPARARTPIRALSGGERNRLLLARLVRVNIPFDVPVPRRAQSRQERTTIPTRHVHIHQRGQRAARAGERGECFLPAPCHFGMIDDDANVRAFGMQPRELVERLLTIACDDRTLRRIVAPVAASIMYIHPSFPACMTTFRPPTRARIGGFGMS